MSLNYTGIFTRELCESFQVDSGAYTALTESELKRATFNVKKDIKELLINMLGKDNISTPDDFEKNKITFRIYNDNTKKDIACYFSKRNKDEMSIYFTSEIIDAYSIEAGDIWFVCEKKDDYYPILGFLKKDDWFGALNGRTQSNDGQFSIQDYLDNEQNQDNEIDDETLYLPEERGEITTPFDPRLVDIEPRTMVISNIVERLKYQEIILDPDFQRNKNLWDEKKQSRLIESLLIKIPLPTFYLDVVEEDKYVVVDGVQRLCAINNFMAKEKDDPTLLHLCGLEYLQDFDGRTFYELPVNLQRRLKEALIQTYIIKAGTPDKVRNSIFERINTGGLVLQPAEIKNSVYRGRASSFVKSLAETQEFVKATNGKVKSERMLDREFVNRFLAFFLLDMDTYHENLEDYLNDVLILLKNDLTIDLNGVKESFLQAMELSYKLFGKYAFRKKLESGKFGRINKPLFEAVSVELAKMDEKEAVILLTHKEEFLKEYYSLFDDDRFVRVITSGTASLESVNYRHEKIKNLIEKYVEKKND